MATFTFEVEDLNPTVLNGVRKEAKAPKYVFKFPTELENFAKLIKAAKDNKGKKTAGGDWLFVTMRGLRNKVEAESIRSDVYELNLRAEGRNTLRSRIREYTQDGETFWLFGVRYLTDDEQANKDAAKAAKAENKNAVSASDLAKVIASIQK